MSRLLTQVEQTIETHSLFGRNHFILVAVSGGLDSMVLLHVLYRLADCYGWMPVVAHFNHQLRGASSDEDAEFVKQAAARLGLKFIGEQADVQQFARKHKLSIEMAARKLRHDFLAATCSALGIRAVALAHHADDQVELFFLRLLRGCGGEGLAGMKWISPSPSDPEVQLARPLLDLSKQELLSFAEQEGIEFRPDATNAELQTERNQIRNELLPFLCRKYQPALAKITLRLMEIIGAESDFIRQTARLWEHRKGDLTFDQLHVAVQRQWVQMELLKLNVAPEFDLIEKLRRGPGQVIMINPRLAVWCDQTGHVQSRKVSSVAFNPDQTVVELSAPEGRTAFGGIVLNWQIEEWQKLQQPRLGAVLGCEFFDAQKIGSPVVLRHWRPGDRFQPIGMDAPVKLQNLFVNHKIPRERRHQLVVAVSESEIFWVEGLRISARFKLEKHTVYSLKWTWERP